MKRWNSMSVHAVHFFEESCAICFIDFIFSVSEPVSESDIVLGHLQVVGVSVGSVESVEDSEGVAEPEFPVVFESESDAAVNLQVDVSLRDSPVV